MFLESFRYFETFCFFVFLFCRPFGGRDSQKNERFTKRDGEEEEGEEGKGCARGVEEKRRRKKDKKKMKPLGERKGREYAKERAYAFLFLAGFCCEDYFFRPFDRSCSQKVVLCFFLVIPILVPLVIALFSYCFLVVVGVTTCQALLACLVVSLFSFRSFFIVPFFFVFCVCFSPSLSFGE